MNATNDDLSHRLRRSLGSTEAPTLSADLVTGAAERPAPHVVNNARRVATAGGLTLAVAAVATVALVVTSPFAQEPLFTAAASGGQASEMSAAADSRLMMWTNYEYLPGASLSTEGGSGHVYQLQRTGTPQEVLATAAAALGVEGEVGESSYFDPAYPSYVVGPEDGTAPSVVVSWSGTGNWWYNDPAAYPQTMSCDAEGVCVDLPVTENLAPSEAEARAIAADLFAATGLDVAESDITVYSDEWQTTATANLVVNGVKTALDWGVGWSSTGAMSYAYGHSVTVVDKGSYSTVSATDAVGRLDDWRWFGSAGPEYQSSVLYAATSDLARSSGTPEVATEEPVAGPTEAPAEPGTSDPGATDPSAPAVDPTVEPAPEPTLVDPMPEPLPTPETVTVTIDEAHATLLLLWDSEGNAWLVPGFAMPHPDGWFSTVVSLIEGVITLPEPVAIEPLDGEIAY